MIAIHFGPVKTSEEEKKGAKIKIEKNEWKRTPYLILYSSTAFLCFSLRVVFSPCSWLFVIVSAVSCTLLSCQVDTTLSYLFLRQL